MFNTINGWTKESMINHIKANFKGKSTDSDGDVCMYRGPKGLKCAIGVFIPDNLYQARMDSPHGLGYKGLFQQFPDLFEHMPLPVNIMGKLQVIHDGAYASPKVDESLDDMLKWIEKNVA